MSFRPLDMQWKREILQKAGPDLLQMLNPEPHLMAELVKANVLLPHDAQNILDYVESSKRKEKLQRRLYMCGTLQFIDFCIILHEKCNREDIVRDVFGLNIADLKLQKERDQHFKVGIQYNAPIPMAVDKGLDQPRAPPKQEAQTEYSVDALSLPPPDRGFRQSRASFLRRQHSFDMYKDGCEGGREWGPAVVPYFDEAQLYHSRKNAETTTPKRQQPKEVPIHTRIEDGEKTQHYFSVIFEERFKAGDSKPESPEYQAFESAVEHGIEAALEDATAVKTKVYVRAISQKKRMVFLHVKCDNGLTEGQLTKALESQIIDFDDRPRHIANRSVHFRDEISATLSHTIVEKSHMQDEFGKKIDLDTQYVKLKMLSKSEMSTVERDEIERPDEQQDEVQKHRGGDMSDEDIIAEGEAKKFVVIRGRAGIGKTTLVEHFMWKWAHGEWARHFNALILLNLRILMAITTNISLPRLLSRCTIYRHEKLAFTKDWLKKNERSLGIFFDGLDEVYNFQELWDEVYNELTMDMKVPPLRWAITLMKRKCLSTCTLVITSRPFAALSNFDPTMMIEVMGLTRERVFEFVNRNVRKDRVTMVTKTLSKRPILLSVSTITFYCAALCQVLQDDIGVTAKLTTYTQITAFILEMFMNHSVKKTGQMKSEVLKKASAGIRSLCQMAYEGLVKRTERGVAQLVFDSHDYERHHLDQKDIDAAREAGLFLQTQIQDPNKQGDRLVLGEFVHLSIQEFLAMTGLLMQDPDYVKRIVTSLSSSQQFSMSLLFLYGLAFDGAHENIQSVNATCGRNTMISEEVSTFLMEAIHDVPNDMQVLQMVHESGSPELARQVGQRRFQKEVMLRDNRATVVDILALTFLLKYHPSVTKIGLINTGLDDLCVKELTKFMRSNTTIKNLGLEDSELGDQNAADLAEMIKVNGTLKELRVNSRKVTEKGVCVLAKGLAGNRGLEELRISTAQIENLGVASLADALTKNKTIKRLNLVGTLLKDAGAEALFEAFKVNKNVTVQVNRSHCDTPAIERRVQGHKRINIMFVGRLPDEHRNPSVHYKLGDR